MPRIHTRFYRLLASVFTIMGMVCAASAWSDERPVLRYHTGSATPQTVNFDEGKLTAVHFWATWCAPCIDEIPEMDSALKVYQPKGLRIIAISMDGTLEKVTQFYGEHAITSLTPVLDYKAQSFNTLKISGLPTTVFFDSSGREIARTEGPMHWLESPNKEFIEQRIGQKDSRENKI